MGMSECICELLSRQLPVELGVRFPGTEFTYDCEPVCVCWELKLGPLEEQPPCFTPELFLQLSQFLGLHRTEIKRSPTLVWFSDAVIKDHNPK